MDNVIIEYIVEPNLEDTEFQADIEILVQKCIICCNLCDPSNVENILDKHNLLDLIQRYLKITIEKNEDSKSICLDCCTKIYNWHSFCIQVEGVHNFDTCSLTLNSMEGSESDRTHSSSDNKNRRKRSGRAETIQSVKAQCKNLVLSSPYNFFMKREMTSEDWEYMAERLVGTKSNSSQKIKEIEIMTLDNDKLISIFCNSCSKSIAGGLAMFQSHVENFHGGNVRIPCDVCSLVFPIKDSSARSQDYFSHWISHFYFDKCSKEGCTEKFPNKFMLTRHMEVHQNRSGYPCPTCNKVLGKKCSLDIHLKTHLSPEQKKKQAKTCPICSKLIYSPSLKAHLSSVHSEECRPWVCDLCSLESKSRFKHKSDLKIHRKTVHYKLRQFSCPLCDKQFGHQCGLRIHLRKHENNRPFSCTFQACDKKFITNWHLQKHLVTHKTVKDVICQVCKKGFKSQEYLKEHMTLHTGEIFTCHICFKKVRVLSNLYKHFKVHKKNNTWRNKDVNALEESSGKVLVTDLTEIVIAGGSSSSHLPESTASTTVLDYEIVSNS